MKYKNFLDFSTLLLIVSFFLIGVAQVKAETVIKDFSLSAATPYVNTGMDIRLGDYVQIRQQTNSSLYPVGRSVPWVSPYGDPGCVSGVGYIIQGTNCWNLVARIGTGYPFIANLGTEFQSSLKGRLYLAINHRIPLQASGSWVVRVIKNGDEPEPEPEEPTPFLDLPWDYEGKGMSFGEAAVKINSYFDHEYPLVSTNLPEDSDSINAVVNYKGIESSNLPYTTHDGYDYGANSGTKTNEPLLAAADGCATYGYGKFSGHHIRIDHGNFYQTRYYHMMDTDLITKSTTECVNVSQGQMIGRVGFSGNVSPAGDAGSHLHFMVVEDKNRDGNFQDNIPDGLTDPYGWQSEDPDPWPNYSFTYAGQERTGNQSYYLWQKSLSNKNENSTKNGSTISLERHSLEIPSGALKETVNFNLSYAPITGFSDVYASLGPIVVIKAFNGFNTPITEFDTPLKLSLDFSLANTDKYFPESLQIFSRSTPADPWTAESTTIDWESKTARAEIDHLSEFGLFGELKDIEPPVTTAVLVGDLVDEVYQGDVLVTLVSQDYPLELGRGVADTFYTFDEDVADWQLYEGPITISEPGSQTIHFYSEDLDENIEFPLNQLSFEITQDSIPPEFKFGLDSETFELIIEGYDESGEVNLEIEPVNDKSSYTFSDSSSNTIQAILEKSETSSKKVLSLSSLTYNSDPVSEPSKALFTATVTRNSDGDLKYLTQYWAFESNDSLLLLYSKKTGYTLVIGKLDNKKVFKFLKGLSLLEVNTDSGAFNVTY